jgi:hypothetical protein
VNCPLPRYYFCHAIISLLIAAVCWPVFGSAGLAAGIAFYAGREFTQWESGLPFDWKGIAAPFVSCLVVLAIYNMLT